MYNAHAITGDFESALRQYTGARFAVATTSCTQAILMALAWFRLTRGPGYVSLPRLTYVGVASSALNADLAILFRDEDWQGEYHLRPFPLWDSARRFTFGMYMPNQMQCVSFHASKILGDSQGGAILHDDPEADAWFRRARFDGRTEGVDARDDQVTYPSWHAYMSPDVAARLLWRLSVLPKHNADLPRSDYPDLSKLKAFK